jgi:hypothetical protein
MARSYKKPYVSDYGKSTYKKKRFASKAVRQFLGDVISGKWYRKLYCSWNIFDYRSYWPEDKKSFRK